MQHGQSIPAKVTQFAISANGEKVSSAFDDFRMERRRLLFWERSMRGAAEHLLSLAGLVFFGLVRSDKAPGQAGPIWTAPPVPHSLTFAWSGGAFHFGRGTAEHLFFLAGRSTPTSACAGGAHMDCAACSAFNDFRMERLRFLLWGGTAEHLLSRRAGQIRKPPPRRLEWLNAEGVAQSKAVQSR